MILGFIIAILIIGLDQLTKFFVYGKIAGSVIGTFLNSDWSGFLGASWCIIFEIYVGIINAI